MVKKRVLTLVLAMMVAGGVFAQEHRHNAGDMLLGLNWYLFGAMMNKSPFTAFDNIADSLTTEITGTPGNLTGTISMDLQKFFLTFRGVNLGVTYEYYIFHWMSVGTGLGIGPELNIATKGGTSKIIVTSQSTEERAKQSAMEQASKIVHVQAGWFLTIPFSVHFNIPKVEWLYTGIGAEIHIPFSDGGLDTLLGSEIAKYLPGGSIKGKTFVSMPIDLGFDFAKTKNNGKIKMSRLLFRFEPEFFGNGLVSMPVTLVIQSPLGKLATVPIPGTK